MDTIESALRRAAAITVLLVVAIQGASAADPAAGAIPDSPSPNIEPSIPFADHGGIFDWRADGRRGIWLQDPGGNWYYGTFMSPCNGLEFADAVAFKTSPSGSFDHWSTVIVHNEIPCHLASFTRSEAPPVLASGSIEPAPDG